GQLGGLAEKVLQALRIAEARNLDENAVVALALDDRLGGAEFVYAAADHLDRLAERRMQAVIDARFRERETQKSRLGLAHLHLGHGAGAEKARRHRLGERRKRLPGGGELL